MTISVLSRRSFLSLLGLASLTPRSRAQQPQTDLSNVSPKNLTAGLRYLYWPSDERGALLVALPAADEVRRGRPGDAPPIPRGREGFRLVDLAAAFDRNVVRFGTITAAIPTTMRVYHLPPGVDRPEELLPDNPQQAQEMFYRSFTPEQWAQLGSPQGIAGSDFRGVQRELFLKALPDPLVFTTPRKDGTNLPEKDAPRVRFFGDERLQLRLRASRRVELNYMPEGTNGNRRTGGPTERVPHDYVGVATESGGNSSPTAAPRMPNRPKPSELDTSKLNAIVSLKGGETLQTAGGIPVRDGAHNRAPMSVNGVLSVSELVERCGKACGLQLYADARGGRTPVLVRGESARAGDILDALARSLTGAFRKVGDSASAAYILTDDVEGLAARLSPIVNLQGAASLERLRSESRNERADTLSHASEPWHSLPVIGASDFPDDFVRRVDAQPWPGYAPAASAGFAISELPPALQTQAHEYLSKHPQTTMSDPIREISDPGFQPEVRAMRTDRVLVSTQAEVSLILPDGGSAPAGSLGGILFSPRLPPESYNYPTITSVSWPDIWKERIVLLDGAHTDDWPGLLASAKRLKATMLVVDVPNHESSLPQLTAAIAAAKAAGLPIGVAIRLLTVPKNQIPARAVVDKNALGESSDQAAERLAKSRRISEFYPDGGPLDRVHLAPAPGAPAKERIETFVRLASTPGLACVIVRDSFPSGYHNFAGEADTRLGFTLANRLSLVRSHQVDPIDFSGYGGNLPADQPIFVNPGGYMDRLDPDPGNVWSTERLAEMKTLRAALFDRLRRTLPQKSLWLESSKPSREISYFARWEKPDLDLSAWNVGDFLLATTARRGVSTSLGVFTPPAPDKLLLFMDDRRGDATAIPGIVGKPWDGVVFDFAETPLTEAWLQAFEKGVKV